MTRFAPAAPVWSRMFVADSRLSLPPTPLRRRIGLWTAAAAAGGGVLMGLATLAAAF